MSKRMTRAELGIEEVETITITLPQKLFQFDSMDDYRNNRHEKWGHCGKDVWNCIAIDALGRILVWPDDYLIAHFDEAFPVQVFYKRNIERYSERYRHLFGGVVK